ncbi:hypothetical protein [uncultured Oscillibacter sp.]|uniref:hypothetical protein n=1 Tax=uncultured Oscillibacter sp. TaxID=876091 RepID=UPI0025D1B3A2|nr:hypothetical protein [uncultured Oscillibacter sp.]
MVNLDCWLPEKEMFGRFSVETICAKREQLEVVVSNEVFRFTIHFPGGVSTYCVMTAEQAQGRLTTLRADHEVYMRGNTFFKLSGSPCEAEYSRPGDTHYLIASSNYVVDIFAGTQPTVQLAQAKKG